MEIINLTVDNQHIVCDRQSLVSDTRLVYECHFTFDKEWEGFTKTAVFKNGATYKEVILSDDKCILPVEAIEDRGYLEIGVYGARDEQLYPTVWTMPLVIMFGSYLGSHENPTPDVYLQLVALYNQVMTTKQDKLPEYLRDKYLHVNDDLQLEWVEVQGGGGGTSDYNQLSNRPQINGYTLEGNKSATSLGLALKDNLDNTIAILNTEKGKIVVLQSDVSNLQTDVSQLDLKVATIEDLIPNQASEENQLADKNFVNSSIATQTAYFQGTFSLEDLGLEYGATHLEIETALETIVGEKTNNDYVFVSIENPTTQIIEKYERYKYTSDDSSWNFEYELNNSSFTAEQWATINSGITSALVSQISTNASDIQTLEGRVDDVEDEIEDLQTEVGGKSTVSVSDTGTSTDEVKYITVDGTEKKLPSGLPVLTGTTEPTTSTVGQIGQLYIKGTAEPYTLYICVEINNGNYLWRKLFASARQGDTYLLTNVSWQNSYSDITNVVIGPNSFSQARGSVVIGNYAHTSGMNKEASVALGMYATTTESHCIQLGQGENSAANSMQVWTHKMLDKTTGLIPKERLNLIKTTMDSVATVQTEYYLGEQSSVSITLPTGSAGEKISVVFYSGTTPTVLSVTNDCLGEVPIPKANERIELSFLHDSQNWCLLSNVMSVPVEVA